MRKQLVTQNKPLFFLQIHEYFVFKVVFNYQHAGAASPSIPPPLSPKELPRLLLLMLSSSKVMKVRESRLCGVPADDRLSWRVCERERDVHMLNTCTHVRLRPVI